MGLKDSHASKVINQNGESILDDSQSIGQDIILSRGFKSIHEHSHIGTKRVLIHALNIFKTLDGEEQDGTSPGYILVVLSVIVDVGTGHLSNFQRFCDINRFCLGNVQGLNQSNIINQLHIWVLVCKLRQQSILKLL
jgi:hypothetical protein